MRPGEVWLDMAGHAQAWFGELRLGKAWFGRA